MKKICAITMVRNDAFFLSRWINYYSQQLGKENVFVLLDGHDQPIPEEAFPGNVFRYAHVEGKVARADKGRIDLISAKAKELLNKYDLVIGTDADEFLLVDPITNKSLAVYLSDLNIKTTVSGLGFDVGQHLLQEKSLDKEKAFLSQRKYALLSPRYTKAVVISKPVNWGSGFHRVKKHNFNIDDNLFLFHFGSVDAEMIREKFLDKDKIDKGWTRHLNKRMKTSHLISNKRILKGENYIKLIRGLQKILRPVFSWNKPGLYGWKTVVEIPFRFREKPLC